MSSDVAAFYKHLRATTAQLLGYADADNLSAAQQIRLERAVSLRMICDDTAARQMRGQPIDVRAFTDASESLEKLCGGSPDAPAAGHDFSGAREELARHFDRLAEAHERRLARDPNKARADLELKIQAAIEKHTLSDPALVLDPAGSDERDRSVAHPGPSPVAAGGSEPAPQSAPQPVLSDVEKMARANSVAVPQHYLKGPRESWRDHIDANGEIISPWFRPHG
jgi:hypothetical protein